jgi:tetraacyldisaccharide 4'-kinase
VCVSAIARPGELARSAEALGLTVVDDRSYPDHHRFRAHEIADALARAKQAGAWLVTTRKDQVRLSPAQRADTHVIDARFEWIDGEEETMARIRQALR